MKHCTTILLLTAALLAAGSAAANPLERGPRKPRKKQRTEQTESPQALPSQQPTASKTLADTPVAPEQTEMRAVRTTPLSAARTDLSPAQYDSLLCLWRERRTLESYERFFGDYIAVDTSAANADRTPDSVYVKRLRALASPIHLPYNAIVKGYIARYTDSRYGLMSRILGLSQYYFPMIEEELVKAGLPVELRALPIIESALSSTAVSPVGAAGLWQFMPATGKIYGLEINSLVDERFDPLPATRAACRYLKDLYAIYNDWTLAIAAYNCGPGNVNKAIARSGGSRSFWEIYDWLPRETRGYVPAFIGASYAYAYHKLHGMEFTAPPLPLSTDTLHIDRLMHFGQIASTIGLSVETLRSLNPQYKIDIIPATTKPYALTLPQRSVTDFITAQGEIFSKDSLYLKEYIDPKNIEKKRTEHTGFVYTVKKGDTLGAIARRYRVSQTNLMRWNKLRSANKLRIGQKLRIEGRSR